jgi:hypothetical protein
MVRSDLRAPDPAAVADLAGLRQKALAPGAPEAAVLAYADRLTALLGPWQDAGGATEVLVDAAGAPALAEHAWDFYRKDGAWPALHPSALTTFTRLVTPEPGAPAAALAPCEPITVLFAIAPGIEASRIQPAEEYVGLVRAAGARGVDLRISILRGARSSDLQREVAARRPHVVHVVAHGRVGGRLALDGEIDATALATALLAGGVVPWLVVLNACYSAGSTGTSEPLAAGLVRKGLPAVVAMGDAVNDRVARTFAWRFYDALADRQPLPMAVARARLAVVAEGFAPPRSFEWARPALFRRPDATLAVREDAGWQRRAAAVANIRGDERPRVLGDRHWLFGEPLRQLGQLADERVVLFRTPREYGGPRKLGRSRILRELGAALVREGHLVVRVRQPSNAAEVTKLVDVLFLFSQAVAEARARHGLPAVDGVVTRLRRVAAGKPPGAPLPPEVNDLVDGANVLPAALAPALRHDLEDLWNAAAAENVVAKDAGRFLLIDELNLYGSFVVGLADMLSEPFALGRADRPVGVAVTLGPSSGQGGSQAVDDAIEQLVQRAGAGRVFLYTVEPLAEAEARAALVHWLLGNYGADGARQPLWTNPQLDEAMRENVLTQLLKMLGGYPGSAPEVESKFAMLVGFQMLVPATAAVEVALGVPPAAGANGG